MPLYSKMLNDLSQKEKEDTFLTGCSVYKPALCQEYIDNDDNLGFSDESDDNLEGGGTWEDNANNSFWCGKVEEVNGNLVISI